MADFVISIGAKVVEYLAEAVLIRPLRPIFCFKTIVDDFHQERVKLNSEEVRVKDGVKRAKDNGREVHQHVDEWVEDVKRVTEDAEKLENELRDNKSCCLATGWTCHYRLSKKVWYNTDSIKKLYERGNLINEVAHPVDLRQHTGLPFSEDFMLSKSADSALCAIMEALVNDDVNIIGLYGMGGIGKTTLAQHIRQEAERSKIFDRSLMITISQTPEVRKIQGVIADFLNVELKQESEEGRASVLNQRLKTEKILIILDDVWKLFNLANIGLFMEECKGCKVLLTTRRLQVCTSMRCHANIPMHLLSEDEAWDFFKKKAYIHDGFEMKDVAKQIVGECKSLPVALATVGSALRNRNTNHWVEALRKLRDARLVDIPEVSDDEKNAYKCLRLSYDYLKHSTSAEAQLLWLLCSMYPEDYEIDMEDLTKCAYGMGLFDRVESVQDARREVWVIVQCLVDSCLLLGTDKKGIVKIHDVVRDVALWIGGTESTERRVFTVRDGRDMNYLIKKESFGNCRAISLLPKSTFELSDYELVCPKLEVIFIFGEGGAIDLPDGFFKHMKSLKVLDIRSYLDEETCDFSIPQSLQYLTDLQTVTLRCHLYPNNSIMGELKHLKILTLINSNLDCAVEAIFTNMKKLKLLHLVNDHDLFTPRKLPPNVIEELISLEELYTYPGYSFGEWKNVYGGGDGERIESCNIAELNSLPNLTRLDTQIVGARSLPIDFCFPSLECYSIAVGPQHDSPPREYDRVMFLSKIIQGSQLNAFQKLFPTVEYLELWKLSLGEGFKNITSCWANTLGASEGFLQNLKELCVKDSKELEALFEFGGQYEPQVQQSLQKLKLFKLWEVKHIWKGPRSFVSLCNLTHMYIEECPKLKAIFSSAVCIAPSLQQLQLLSISDCDDIEEVVSAEYDSDNDFSCCFQNLRRLNVYKCDNLKAIFSMHMTMMTHPRLHLPKLQEITLRYNHELEHVFGNQMEAEAEPWPSLEVLHVVGCPKLSPDFVANIQTQLRAPSAAKKFRSIYLTDMQGVENMTLS